MRLLKLQQEFLNNLYVFRQFKAVGLWTPSISFLGFFVWWQQPCKVIYVYSGIKVNSRTHTCSLQIRLTSNQQFSGANLGFLKGEGLRLTGMYQVTSQILEDTKLSHKALVVRFMWLIHGQVILAIWNNDYISV